MYFRYIFLILFSCCFALCVHAQQLFTIGGTVYKKNYTDKIAQVQVTNIGKKLNTLTDNFGVFHIQVAKGDTLLFKKPDFTPEYFVISGSYDINVYMQPVYVLNEVTVKELSKKQELKETLNQYRKQGIYSDGKPKALSFLASPLTGMYELFGKDAGRIRRFKEYSKNELEHLEVSKKYNKSIVKKLTNMPDNEIDDFMSFYSPPYEIVKNWNEYDVITYINKNYKYFQENKANLKLQKLY
jgi:hypothetical protein